MKPALALVLCCLCWSAGGCSSDSEKAKAPTPDIGPSIDTTADSGPPDLPVTPDLAPDPDLPPQLDMPPPPPDADRPRDFTIFTDKGTKLDGPSCAPSNDSCTAPKVLTWSGNTIVENGDSTCGSDDLDFPVNACGGQLVDGTGGADVFYEITLPVGSYEIRLSAPGWDPALYVLDACSTGNCVVASDEVNAGVAEKVAISLPAPTKLLIGVDAFDDANSGKFALTIEGTTSPPKDSGPAPDTTIDAGPSPDSTVDAGPGPDAADDIGLPPDGGGSGNIVLTELMPNPKAVGDTAGEWFELHNPGSASINLKNWRIEDKPSSSQNVHTIATDLIVPAGGYVVLGRDASTTTNGGAPVDYAYGTAFTLANSADEVYIFDASGALADKVEYDKASGWTVPEGATMSLSAPSLDNNVAANWCSEANAWSGSAGDKGTPGAASACP